MEIDRKQIKQQARESMLLAKPSFWVVTLVYMLMTTGVSIIADFSDGTLGLFLTIAITMYSWVVGFSYRLWAIWTVRRLEPGLGSLMEGFSVAGRVIMLESSILVRTLGWTFMMAIPAGFLLVFSMTTNLLGYFLVIGLLSIAVSIITLRYSMAAYVLADYPDLGPGYALHQSVQLTRGWIGELVKLHLSFIGWYILSTVLSFAGMVVGALVSGGITVAALLTPDGFAQLPTVLSAGIPSLLGTLLSLPVTLYLTPYIEVTMAQFYDARIRLGEPAGDMPPL
jgi:hypothetical protein